MAHHPSGPRVESHHRIDALTSTFQPRIALVNSASESWRFFRGQIRAICNAGFEVHCISSAGPELTDVENEGAKTHCVPVSRLIRPHEDVLTIMRLAALFSAVRPHVVHAHTSKAGIVAMASARLAGVPRRVYHNHGMAALSAIGWRRTLLRQCEQTASRWATDVVYVTPSVRTAAIDEGFVDSDKTRVILSINGLDTDEQFNPRRYDRDSERARLGFHSRNVVLGFVGRRLRIKGVCELARAWRQMREVYPQTRLLMVGADDYRDPVPTSVRNALETDDRVTMTGFVSNTAPLYAAMDILIQPSYHEGLGYVSIEAGAMGVPCVGTRIPGTVDAIQDGVTGILIPPRNVEVIVDGVSTYIKDPELGRRHATAARDFVVNRFNQQRVWAETIGLYRSLVS